MSFFPIPGVGLGGLVSSTNPIIGTGPKSFFSSPTLVLDGLPLTNDEFRTHRLPMPKLRMTGHTTRPFAAPTEEPRLSYAIYDQHDTSRSNCAKHTQRQAVILAACSGFATSAAPAPPSKAPFHSSPPTRSTLLAPRSYSVVMLPPTRRRPQLDHSRLQLLLSCKPLLLRVTTPAPQLNTSQIPC